LLPFNPSDLVNNAYWIVLAPAIAATLIILLSFMHKGPGGKTLAATLSIGAVVFGFAYSILLLQAFLTSPQRDVLPAMQMPEWTFFHSGNIKLAIGVLVDNLSVMMLLVVTSVSLLVQVYTHGYMREDPGYSRFYAYLSLFTASMLGLVLATNLFQMYFFWELVGVCSYFLIGFWFFKESASRACLKAFIVNRIGDCLFLIGLLLLIGATASGGHDFWKGHTLLSFAGGQEFSLPAVLKLALESNALTYGNPLTSFAGNNLALIACFIFVGPMAKSAQAPLHVWLPDAMEGPTPISALIHAATMVAAGVYLVARAYPLWQVVPAGQTENFGFEFIGFIGTFTAFMAATIAMSQFDIKRGLAWSTVSQLGYMFAGLAAGAYTGGLFHLFNHAFFKAMLFLCSGAVIHGMHGEQDMRQMGGLRKHMKGTAICFLIGTLSISGFPLMSGFFSKDDIISAAWHHNPLMGGTLLLTAGLTAFYMFRLYFMTFEGEYRGTVQPHNSPPAMVYPLIALAVPSICSGWLGLPQTAQGISDWFAGKEIPTPFAHFVNFGGAHFEGADATLMLAGTTCAAVGFVLSYMIYFSKKSDLNTQIATSTSPLVSALYKFSFNKWYFDERYQDMLNGLLALYDAVWTFVDLRIVDNVVNFTALVTTSAGEALKYTENGRGQSYALVIFGCVAVLTLVAYFWPALHP
jgi:NAD(P)H-quinone oxidoreductase subunit 5